MSGRKSGTISVSSRNVKKQALPKKEEERVISRTYVHEPIVLPPRPSSLFVQVQFKSVMWTQTHFEHLFTLGDTVSKLLHEICKRHIEIEKRALVIYKTLIPSTSLEEVSKPLYDLDFPGGHRATPPKQIVYYDFITINNDCPIINDKITTIDIRRDKLRDSSQTSMHM
ncbi:hypothetical protein PROFUN_06578 [Planoprotostelium fungivorum]|uniref:Uncharacterized protein n=1 Tax=Planoprotostelium fungivorum TaxID=1890364 RepID=A0A2P6MRW5_9EUKA|nr:hypothetical protein PROFUN_06578 [Planoprotostelium fungivorum]